MWAVEAIFLSFAPGPRNIPVSYCGIDVTPSLIEIGQQEMPKYGLPAENLKVMKLQDLNGSADLVLSMNFLTYLDNFHAPLERLLDIAKVGVILRESISDKARFAYVVDDHLDPGLTLSVHINTYRQTDITDFMISRGQFGNLWTDAQKANRKSFSSNRIIGNS